MGSISLTLGLFKVKITFMKARRQGGRIIFVGDKRQAIYGFTGADTQSIQTHTCIG